MSASFSRGKKREENSPLWGVSLQSSWLARVEGRWSELLYRHYTENCRIRCELSTSSHLLEASSLVARTPWLANARGKFVLLVFSLEASAEFLIGFGACLLANAIPVPLKPPEVRMSATVLAQVPKSLEYHACIVDKMLTSDRTAGVLTSSDLDRLVSLVRAARLVVTLGSANYLIVDLPWVAIQTPPFPHSSERDKALPSALATLRLAAQTSAGQSDVAYVQCSSGSTADSKGVLVKHSAVLANIAYMRKDLHMDSESCTASFVPVFHDMGCVGGLLNALVGGGSYVAISPISFLRRPLLLFEVISASRVSHVAMPPVALLLLTDAFESSPQAARKNWNFDRLINVSVGSDFVAPALVWRFFRAFPALDPSLFSQVYGLAEAVMYCAGNHPEMNQFVGFDRESLVSDGVAKVVAKFPLSAAREVDVPARIQNTTKDELWLVSVALSPDLQKLTYAIVTDGQCLPPGKVGEICIAGESVNEGYIGWSHEASAEVFANSLPGFDGQTFLRTGDAGFILDNHLFVCGRFKDVIIANGRNVHACDIEATLIALAQHEPVTRTLVTVGRMVVGEVDLTECPDSGALINWASNAMTKHVVIVLEVKAPALSCKDTELIVVADKFVEQVARVHGISVDHIFFVRKGSVTKTSSGKLQRRQVLNRLANGALVPILARHAVGQQATQSNIARDTIDVARMIALVRQHLHVAEGIELNEETDLIELGATSAHIISLKLAIESITGNPIPATMIFENSVLGHLVDELNDNTDDKFSAVSAPTLPSVWFDSRTSSDHSRELGGKRDQLSFDDTKISALTEFCAVLKSILQSDNDVAPDTQITSLLVQPDDARAVLGVCTGIAGTMFTANELMRMASVKDLHEHLVRRGQATALSRPANSQRRQHSTTKSWVARNIHSHTSEHDRCSSIGRVFFAVFVLTLLVTLAGSTHPWSFAFASLLAAAISGAIAIRFTDQNLATGLQEGIASEWLDSVSTEIENEVWRKFHPRSWVEMLLFEALCTITGFIFNTTAIHREHAVDCRLAVLSKREHFGLRKSSPWLWFLSLIRALPINRDHGSVRGVVDKAVNVVVQHSMALLIHPEGTRADPDLVRTGFVDAAAWKEGAVLVAQRSNASVLPVGLSGFTWFKDESLVAFLARTVLARNRKVHVYFGAAVHSHAASSKVLLASVQHCVSRVLTDPTVQMLHSFRPSTVALLLRLLGTLPPEVTLCIVGTGFSRGDQSVSKFPTARIDMCGFNRIRHLDRENSTVIVESGVTWRQLDDYLLGTGLAPTVRQSYEDFSIGGSIAVNAHGRFVGMNGGNTMACTMASMEVITFDGEQGAARHHRVVEPGSELFRCTVGGFGLIGIIVSVTLRLTPNVIVELHEATNMELNGYSTIEFCAEDVLHFARLSVDTNTLFDKVQVYTYRVAPVIERGLLHDRDLKRRSIVDRPVQFLQSVLLATTNAPIQMLRNSAKQLRYQLEYGWRSRHSRVLRSQAASEYLPVLGSPVDAVAGIPRMRSGVALAEVFLPANEIVAFLKEVKNYILHAEATEGVHVLNTTLRSVQQDVSNTPLLSYVAGREARSAVFFLSGPTREAVAELTRKLYSASVRRGGSFYLPYERDTVTVDLVSDAYGRQHVQSFIDARSRWDPYQRLRSTFGDTYFATIPADEAISDRLSFNVGTGTFLDVTRSLRMVVVRDSKTFKLEWHSPSWWEVVVVGFVAWIMSTLIPFLLSVPFLYALTCVHYTSIRVHSNGDDPYKGSIDIIDTTMRPALQIARVQVNFVAGRHHHEGTLQVHWAGDGEVARSTRETVVAQVVALLRAQAGSQAISVVKSNALIPSHSVLRMRHICPDETVVLNKSGRFVQVWHPTDGATQTEFVLVVDCGRDPQGSYVASKLAAGCREAALVILDKISDIFEAMDIIDEAHLALQGRQCCRVVAVTRNASIATLLWIVSMRRSCIRAIHLVNGALDRFEHDQRNLEPGPFAGTRIMSGSVEIVSRSSGIWQHWAGELWSLDHEAVSLPLVQFVEEIPARALNAKVTQALLSHASWQTQIIRATLTQATNAIISGWSGPLCQLITDVPSLPQIWSARKTCSLLTKECTAASIHEVTADDGMSILLEYYEPESSVINDVVLCSHGAGINASQFRQQHKMGSTSLVTWLVAQGYAVVLFFRRTATYATRAVALGNDDVLTFEKEAQFDWPAAVAETRHRYPQARIHTVAPCWGALALSKSLRCGYTDPSDLASIIQLQSNAMQALPATSIPGSLLQLLEPFFFMGLTGRFIGASTSPSFMSWLFQKLVEMQRSSDELCEVPQCHQLAQIFGAYVSHTFVDSQLHAVNVAEYACGSLGRAAIRQMAAAAYESEYNAHDAGKLDYGSIPTLLVSSAANQVLAAPAQLARESLDFRSPVRHIVVPDAGHMDLTLSSMEVEVMRHVITGWISCVSSEVKF